MASFTGLPELSMPFPPVPYAQPQPQMGMRMPQGQPAAIPESNIAGLPQGWEGMSHDAIMEWGRQRQSQAAPQRGAGGPTGIATQVGGTGEVSGGQMSPEQDRRNRSMQRRDEAYGRFGGGPQGIATPAAPEVKSGSVDAPMGKPQPVAPVTGGGSLVGGSMKPQSFGMGMRQPPSGRFGDMMPPQMGGFQATSKPGEAQGGFAAPPKQDSGQRFMDFFGSTGQARRF